MTYTDETIADRGANGAVFRGTARDGLGYEYDVVVKFGKKKCDNYKLGA